MIEIEALSALKDQPDVLIEGRSVKVNMSHNPFTAGEYKAMIFLEGLGYSRKMITRDMFKELKERQK